jgi:hypothetical protein
MAEGAERILDLLVDSELPDEAWLRTIATFGELNGRGRGMGDGGRGDGGRGDGVNSVQSIVALVLLEPA